MGLGLGASTRHWREKLVNLRFCLYLLLVGGPGIVIGALMATRLPEDVARISLGVAILALAIMTQYFTSRMAKPTRLIKRSLYWTIGSAGIFLIGLLNGSLTSGTWLFFTFWLVSWFHKPFTQSLSYTMIVCSLAHNLIGAIVLGTNVAVNWEFVIALTFGAILSGYAGSSLSLLKGDLFIHLVFTTSCILIGASLLYSGVIESFR